MNVCCTILLSFVIIGSSESELRDTFGAKLCNVHFEYLYVSWHQLISIKKIIRSR